jgi:hypothetical protein
MSPFAKEILDGARAAHDPTAADRARVAAKLASRIGSNAAPGGGKGAAAGLAGLLKVGLPLAIVVAALGFAMKRGSGVGHAAPVEAQPTVVAAPALPAPADPPGPPAAAPVELPAPAPAAPAKDTARASSNDSVVPMAAAPPAAARSSRAPEAAAPSDLAGEMALIAAAQTAIQQGDYATAIAKLDEHQRSYPSGVLGEERTAARVVALCGAGQQAEARSVATAFLARHPSSPLAPRVRASCAMQ